MDNSNVVVDSAAPATEKKVQTNRSLACNGQMACSGPTLHVGLDGDENE